MIASRIGHPPEGSSKPLGPRPVGELKSDLHSTEPLLDSHGCEWQFTEKANDGLSEPLCVGMPSAAVINGKLVSRESKSATKEPDMDSQSHQKAHEDHIQWERHHEAWLRDVASWKDEHRAALDRVRELFESHDEAVEAHAEAVRQHLQSFDMHEMAIAEHERGGVGDMHEAMDKRHRERESEHTARLAVHERMRRHHHSVMTCIAQLEKALKHEL